LTRIRNSKRAKEEEEEESLRESATWAIKNVCKTTTTRAAREDHSFYFDSSASVMTSH
jgi:hypothetical protein